MIPRAASRPQSAEEKLATHFDGVAGDLVEPAQELRIGHSVGEHA